MDLYSSCIRAQCNSLLLFLLSLLVTRYYSANAEIQSHEFVVSLFLYHLLPFYNFFAVVNYLPFLLNYQQVQATAVNRLCRTQNIITVNGQFPGPNLEVRNGDTLIIKVLNQAQYNVTIHW